MDFDSARNRDHCIRCGECCLTSSPSLQMEDAPLVKEGHIGLSSLYTIRPGEAVRDNVREELQVTEQEIVKIKEKKDGRACSYYDEEGKACGIYEHRPVQCAALACWDTSEFMKVHKRPKARRKDIIQDPALLRLIQ